MLVQHNFSLFTFAATYAAVVSVPGPNLLLVTRASLLGRRPGAAAALGIAAGAAATAALVLAGISALNVPLEGVLALSVVYGAVLLRSGCRCLPLFRPPMPHSLETRQGIRGYFLNGLMTAATNPMTAAFFIGASAGFVSDGTPYPSATAAMTVFAIALAWFGALGLLLSASGPRELYQRARTLADWAMGLLLISIGWAVIVEAGLRAAHVWNFITPEAASLFH